MGTEIIIVLSIFFGIFFVILIIFLILKRIAYKRLREKVRWGQAFVHLITEKRRFGGIYKYLGVIIRRPCDKDMQEL
jgi:hypothetical protein